MFINLDSKCQKVTICIRRLVLFRRQLQSHTNIDNLQIQIIIGYLITFGRG